MREGRKLSASVICDDERCGERRVLLGGVTKFHERVSPLRPASARECDEKKRSLVRARGRETDRNVLGSPLLAARVIRRERERDTRRDGRANRSGRRRERRIACGGRKRKRCGAKRTRRGLTLPSPRVPFVIASFSRERERPARRPERRKRREDLEYIRGVKERKKNERKKQVSRARRRRRDSVSFCSISTSALLER